MTPSGFGSKSVSKATRFVRYAARWLDHQPLPLVIAAGIVLGLGIGLPGFLYLRSPLWIMLWEAASPCGASATWPSRCLRRRTRLLPGHNECRRPFVMMALPGGSF